MPYENFDFVGSFNENFSTQIDPQNTINMYEIFEPASPKEKSLLPWPGSLLKINLGIDKNSLNRGSFVFNDHMYYVFGAFIYEFSTDLSFKLIGTLNTTQGHVDIDANPSQLLFVDGADGWIWDGISFTQIIATDFPIAPISVTYFDGRFYVSSKGTNQFSSSAQQDGLTWPPLEFAKLTTKGDIIVGLKMLKTRTYVFGTFIIESWYDAGSTGFPLLRDSNETIGYGLSSLASLAGNETVLIFLSKTRNGSSCIMMIQDGQIQKISTSAIDLKLQEYSRIIVDNINGLQDAIGYIIEINAQQFYVLNLTIANVTIVYNIMTKKWHYLSMLNGSRYFGQYHVHFNSKHYLGSYLSPKLYEISRNFFTNDGEAIKRTRISRIFRTPTGKRICINMFEIQFVQGNYELPPNDNGIYFDDNDAFYTNDQHEVYWDDVYNANPESADVDPIAYLSISTNGGKSFGFEVSRPLGNIGQYDLRSIWNNLGIGDSFVIKMDVYAALPLIVIGANNQYDILRF